MYVRRGTSRGVGDAMHAVCGQGVSTSLAMQVPVETLKQWALAKGGMHTEGGRREHNGENPELTPRSTARIRLSRFTMSRLTAHFPA